MKSQRKLGSFKVTPELIAEAINDMTADLLSWEGHPVLTLDLSRVLFENRSEKAKGEYPDESEEDFAVLLQQALIPEYAERYDGDQPIKVHEVVSVSWCPDEFFNMDVTIRLDGLEYVKAKPTLRRILP